jgi:hypothetical protein
MKVVAARKEPLFLLSLYIEMFFEFVQIRMSQMEKSSEVGAAFVPTSVLGNTVDVGGSDLAAGRNADKRRRNSLAAGG